ncbi:hypothetical protein EV363DRAFT_1335151 [Boletus edulis]|nr:hypothetical protein EV363DRAFT_1335151 [Boletus edulis]
MPLKVPILLPSVWLFNISFMSPNAPPDKSERVNGAFYERICPATWPILHRLSASTPCFAELVVLLAIDYPSPLSSEVLSRLILSGGRPPISRVNCYFLLGSVIAAIGGLGRLWCFRALGRHFTHQLALRKDHELITTGPYAIVRHPGYLFGQLSALGMSLMIGSPGSFMRRCGWLGTTVGQVVVGVWAMQVVLGWVLSLARCRSEDTLLRKRFGERWDGYSQRVRYRMIPGVY